MGRLGKTDRLKTLNKNMSYRYIIYKLFKWGLKRKNDTPVFNVIVTMAIVHFLQILTIYHILLKYFGIYNIYTSNNAVWVAVFFILLMILYYFVVYDKSRWEGYINEFTNEDKGASSRGTIYVLTYIIGSIVMFFMVMMLLFG